MHTNLIESLKNTIGTLFIKPKIDVSKISKHALGIILSLQKNNYEAYIVGGAIRDILINHNPKDFDIATSATPEQIRRIFKKSRIIGRRFKLVHVLDGRDIIEVSTFRAKPQEREIMANGVERDNAYGTLKEDAERRDFTSNSIYFNPTNKKLIDFYGGIDDIKNKQLSIIGIPEIRFQEDPVRILRAIRFAAKLDLTINADITSIIHKNINLLENIPYSRLFDEVMKLFLTGHALKSVILFNKFNLSKKFFPVLQSTSPSTQAFLRQGLKDTDKRIHENKSINPGFLLAVFLWRDVNETWEKRKKTSINNTVALNTAIDFVLSKQSKIFPVQKRFIVTMSEIWRLQPRFKNLNPKRIYRLLGHPRFRAAYDFLLLRNRQGEINNDLAQWWIKFVEADDKTKSILIKKTKKNG
jgi:poly(A) polymerase